MSNDLFAVFQFSLMLFFEIKLVIGFTPQLKLAVIIKYNLISNCPNRMAAADTTVFVTVSTVDVP